MKIKNVFLLVGSILNFCAAAIHLATALVPQWSAIFSGGDFLVPNPRLLQAASLVVMILCTIWAFYGLSGAGLIRRLPLLRLGIFLIGAIYVPYGLLIIFRELGLVSSLPSSGMMNLPSWLVTFGALTAGILYWLGLAVGWKQLGRKPIPTHV